jgi:hypothetical protein
MSDLWVEIETLVLDGVPMNSAQGKRLAQLTEIALAHLLEQRGTHTRVSLGRDEERKKVHNPGPATMRAPANANEAKWAEELALALYRVMDRTL